MIKFELFNAILAMDSYNRGYNAGISTLSDATGVRIGNATIFDTQENPEAQSIGFYAIAYDVQGAGKIISYRGTDRFTSLPFYDEDEGSDIWNGWNVGLGSTENKQAAMAFEFYEAVAVNGLGQTIDPRSASITLTGHSLGGGLAGLVGGAYGKEGILFDNMPFEFALANTHYEASHGNTQLKQLIYGGAGDIWASNPWNTDLSDLQTIYMDGEPLEVPRFTQVGTPDTELKLGGSVNLASYFPDANALHSMSALVIRMFADSRYSDQVSTSDWEKSAPYFWPLLFNKSYAEQIGINTLAGVSAADVKLRDIIAYSAIDQGEMPFGDTAIRALYNDANDFGRVLQKTGLSQLLLAHADDITKSYVHFAGLLALNDVEKKDQPQVLAGIVAYPTATNAALSINYSDSLWRGVNNGEMPTMSTRAELLGDLYTEMGNTNDIRRATLKMWGNDTVNVIDRVVFAVAEAGGAAKIETLAANNKGTLFVGGTGADTVTGSENHELFYTGIGNDTVNAGMGDDIILASAGNDTIDGSGGSDLMDYSSSPGAVSKPGTGNYFIDGWGGQDRLSYIEHFIFSRYDDKILYVTLPTIGSSRISYDGGAGNDQISFSGTVFYDMNAGLHYSDSGNSRVSITNFETINYETKITVPPLAGSWSVPIDSSLILDYSASKSSIVFDLVEAYFNNTDGGYAGARPGSITGAGFTHALTPVPLGGGPTGPYTGPSIKSIYGSNYGDVFYTHWIAYSYDVHTGKGNDTVYVQLAAGDFINIHYTGGNDIYHVTESLNAIYLDRSIILSDITNIQVTSSGITDFFATLTINGFGTLKISHTDYGLNSVPVILDSGGQIVFTAGETDYTVSGGSQVFTTLYGTWGNDIWSSRTGYSQIYFGRSGDDTLHGNDGDDGLYGGEGIDRLYGGEGIDELWGGFGADIIEGGNGNDGIYGEDDNDTLIGGAGTDTISGGAGNDVITGGAGLDYLYGDAGSDTYVFAAGDSPISTPDVVYAENIDTIKLTGISPQNTQVYKLNGVWHVRYTANDDITIQPWRDPSPTAAPGGDNFIGKIVFDNGTAWDFSNGYTINDTDDSNSMEGTNLSDTLNGRGGNDLIRAEDGNDTLNGGTGIDSLWGGKGDDTYVFAVGDSSLGDFVSDVAGEGTDTIKLIGVLPQNVSLTIGAFDSLEIQYSPTDKLSVKGWILSGSGSTGSSGRYAAEKIIFDNGTVWDITAGLTLNDSNDAHNVKGTEFSDIINANGGDDTMRAGSGNDSVNGGIGNDAIYGEAGSDVLIGGDGDDSITGSADLFAQDNGIVDNDTLEGGKGVDQLYGSWGDDIYVFRAGDSPIAAPDNIYEVVNQGIDTIKLTGGILPQNVTVTKLSSNVWYSIKFGSDEIRLTGLTPSGSSFSSTNTLTVEKIAFDNGTVLNLIDLLNVTPVNPYSTTTGNDIIVASAATSAVTINLLAGNDSFTGSNYNDNVTAGDGNDTVEGRGGNDVMSGGNGTDRVIYASATAAVTVNLATTAAQNTVGAGTDTISTFENLTGSAYNDTLTGNSGANAIDGGSGNDVIDGAAGDDVLTGGAGTDTLSYASATAAVTVNLATTTAQNTVGSGTDTISTFENLTGSNYNDTLTGDANANVIEGRAGNDVLNGSAGTDTVTYASATAAVTVNLATTTSQNTVGAGSDTITNFENLTGSNYNDTLTGNTGANRIDGGSGNDTIQGGTGNDTLIGGAGTDTVTYAAATAAVTVNLATTAAQNTVAAGSDTISGFENLTGSGYNDTLRGDTLANTVRGGNGNDAIYGNSGNDILYGDAGTDTLYGDAGNDTLYGGASNDVLYGGAGADIFKFQASGGIDTIKDFKTSELDKLDIKDLLSGYDPATKAITDFIQITTSGTSSIVKIDANGLTGGVAWTQIATMENITGLTDEAALKANGTIIA